MTEIVANLFVKAQEGASFPADISLVVQDEHRDFLVPILVVKLVVGTPKESSRRLEELTDMIRSQTRRGKRVLTVPGRGFTGVAAVLACYLVRFTDMGAGRCLRIVEELTDGALLSLDGFRAAFVHFFAHVVLKEREHRRTRHNESSGCSLKSCFE